MITYEIPVNNNGDEPKILFGPQRPDSGSDTSDSEIAAIRLNLLNLEDTLTSMGIPVHPAASLTSRLSSIDATIVKILTNDMATSGDHRVPEATTPDEEFDADDECWLSEQK